MGEIAAPDLGPVAISESSVIIDSSVPTKDYSLDAFYHWLSEEEKMAPASCRGYSSSIRSISEYAVANGWLTNTIYEIADEEELKETVATLLPKDYKKVLH